MSSVKKRAFFDVLEIVLFNLKKISKSNVDSEAAFLGYSNLSPPTVIQNRCGSDFKGL